MSGSCGPSTGTCEQTIQSLCACDASFYSILCGNPLGQCNYNLPDCSSTPVRYDYTAVQPSAQAVFASCTDHYSRQTSSFKTFIAIHMAIVLITLLGTGTSCFSIPIGRFKLLHLFIYLFIIYEFIYLLIIYIFILKFIIYSFIFFLFLYCLFWVSYYLCIT